jgi:hypothetical protein
MAIAMSPTEESIETLRNHIPEACIYNYFDSEKIETLLVHQRELLRKKTPKSVTLVLDDIMYDKKALKGNVIRDLFMNGRHLHITVIISIQYLMDLSPDLRTNVDYCFSLRENIKLNREKLWKYFFGNFENYNDFACVFDQCTKDYSSIVMDNTSGGDIQDTIFWYKAELYPDPFKIGSSVYWKYSDMYMKNATTPSPPSAKKKLRIQNVCCEN